MTRTFRWWLGGLGGVALAIGIMAATSRVDAADEDLKAMCKQIPKLAKAIQKKDSATVKKMVASIGKNYELDSIMGVCGLRNLGGLGVGPVKGKIKPDGIEKKIESLAKKPLTKKQLAAEAPAIAEFAYIVAAVNEVTIAQTPAKDQGQSKKKTWIETAKSIQKASMALAAAAKKSPPDPKEIRAIASTLDTACMKCHSEWR